MKNCSDLRYNLLDKYMTITRLFIAYFLNFVVLVILFDVTITHLILINFNSCASTISVGLHVFIDGIDNKNYAKLK